MSGKKKLEGLGLKIFEQRYSYPGEKDYSDRAWSMAKHVASCEPEDVREKIQDKFYQVLGNADLIPGGRIIFGAGRSQQNLLNCYAIEPEDSVESIGKTLQDMYKISCGGGGIGFNFSKIRPKGDDIGIIKNSAPGSVSVMKMINEVGNHVKAGKNRRTALMSELNVDHPDILEFLKVKLDLGQLNNFNISVAITDDFISACEKNEQWTFKFKNKVYNVYGANRTSPNGTVEYINIVATSEEDAIQRGLQHHLVHPDDKFVDVCKIELKALDLWNRLWENAVKSGEPGIFNLSLTNRFTNVSYFLQMNQTNPCLTKDTYVAVADGRGSVKIGDLVNEGKDVPVYALNTKTDRIEVKMMRNPRKTGGNKQIVKVTLDDGSSIRCTDNHKFILKTGETKEAKDLLPSDQLTLMTRDKGKLSKFIPGIRSKDSNPDYWGILYDGMRPKTEHRMIAEYFYGKIPNKFVVHHKDFNSENNNPENLQVMSSEDHNELHSRLMIGDNNPMRRAHTEWSDEKWEEYRKNMSEATGGLKNGNSTGITNTELFDKAVELTRSLGRRFSREEWQTYAKDNNLPITFSKFRRNEYGDILNFSKLVAEYCGVEHLDADPRTVRSFQEYVKAGGNAVIEDRSIFVLKSCEDCSAQIKLPFNYREISYCKECIDIRRSNNITSEAVRDSFRAAIKDRKEDGRFKQLSAYTKLKFDLARNPFKKEWESYCRDNSIRFRFGKHSPFNTYGDLVEAASNFNHRVKSVELDGFEDVYNGTVDDHHNFFINGNNSNQFVCIKQCGEIPLESYANCCLGHVNLSNMITDDGKDVNWPRLANAVRVGVRFLDDVLTVNHYPIPECKISGERTRRIGLGTLGLHHMLIKLGIRYGSEKCLEFLDRLYSTIRDEAYKESMRLAQEKGSFPMFDADKFLKEEFAKTLPARIRMYIRQNGIRNALILTAAPTGTVSMVHGTSTGIEPIFAPMYKRRYREGNTWREEIVLDTLFKEALENNQPANHIVGAYDITPEEHMAVQATIQRYVDNAISKTINLPTDATSKEVSKMALKYIPYLKGMTVYRAGSRGAEPMEVMPLTPENIELAKELIKSKKAETALDGGSCRVGGECGS